MREFFIGGVKSSEIFLKRLIEMDADVGEIYVEELHLIKCIV